MNKSPIPIIIKYMALVTTVCLSSSLTIIKPSIAEASEQHYREITKYAQAIIVTPEDSLFYSRRGDAYYHSGQYEQAIAEFTKAIEIDPSEANAYAKRGLIYLKLEQYDRAIADSTQAIKSEPQKAISYQVRSLAHQALGNIAQAKTDTERAASLYKSQNNLQEYEKALSRLETLEKEYSE